MNRPTDGATNAVGPDEGGPDPRLSAALLAWESDRTPKAEAAVQAALVGARLLVPVVPIPADEDSPGSQEMARPVLIGADGRPAEPAFTSVASMAAWQGDARPLPAPGRDVLSAASEAGRAVVLDVAGPVPYVVQGDVLNLLATGVIRLDGDAIQAQIAGRPVEGGLSHVTQPAAAPEALRQVLAAALTAEPLVAEAYLLAPETGPDASDLAVGLVLSADVTPAILVRLVRRLADALGTAPGVHHGLDIAVLTESQRATARAFGPPVHVARA